MRHPLLPCGASLCVALTVAAVTASGGAVTGTVHYAGEVPAMKPMAMDVDPVCSAQHAEPPPAETLVLGDGMTMANVLVSIRNAPAGDYPVPAEPAVLDQIGCIYKPHFLAVRVGQTVRILNSDETLHNIHALPRVNDEVNHAMPKFRKELSQTFDQAETEPFPLKCDVHPWMLCWVAVLPHPFFDVTEVDGAYTIEGLAAGTYEVQAWHENLGAQSATVTVEAEGSASADFTFSEP